MDQMNNSVNSQMIQDNDRSIVEAKLFEIVQNQVIKYKAMNPDIDDIDQVNTNLNVENEAENSFDKINEADFISGNNIFELLNSVTYISLIVAIENEFDIEFNDEDLRLGKFQSLKNLTDFIVERKSKLQ